MELYGKYHCICDIICIMKTKIIKIHPLLGLLVIIAMITLMVFMLFIFSYVFVIALIIGSILFIIGFVRTKFFKQKDSVIYEQFVVEIKKTHDSDSTKNSGRLIVADESGCRSIIYSGGRSVT